METYCIRQGTVDDIERMTELFVQTFKEAPYHEHWHKHDAMRRIQDYFSYARILVLTDNNVIMGFLVGNTYRWVDGVRASIQELVVDKVARNKGFGRQLIHSFENELEGEDIASIQLFTRVDSKAYEIYKHLGYEETTLVGMEKKLPK